MTNWLQQIHKNSMDNCLTKKEVNFHRLNQLVYGIGNGVLGAFLNKKLTENNYELHEYLEREKHTLFHMTKYKYCCLCRKEKRNHLSPINPEQWNIMYENTHKTGNGDYILNFHAKVGISSDSFDVSLLCVLLLHSKKLNIDPSEKRLISSIQSRRNKDISHRPKLAMEDTKFDEIWKVLETSLLELASICSPKLLSQIKVEIDCTKEAFFTKKELLSLMNGWYRFPTIPDAFTNPFGTYGRKTIIQTDQEYIRQQLKKSVVIKEIVSEMEPLSIMENFLKKRIITRPEYEQVQILALRKDRCRHILKMTQSDSILGSFLDALEETRQTDLLNYITKGNHEKIPRTPISVDWQVMDIADSNLEIKIKIQNRPDLEANAVRNLSILEDDIEELIKRFADLKIDDIRKGCIIIQLNVAGSDAVKNFHEAYQRGDVNMLIEEILEKANILKEVIKDQIRVQVTIRSSMECFEGNRREFSTQGVFYDKFRAYLCEELSPSPICALLHERGILDTDDVNEIFESRNRRRADKTACLLNLMKAKDPETLQDFKECLVLTDHGYILGKVTPEDCVKDSLTNGETLDTFTYPFGTHAEKSFTQTDHETVYQLLKTTPFIHYMTREMEPVPVMDYMLEDSAITLSDYEHVGKLPLREERCKYLLEMISSRCTLESFVDALGETQQTDLHEFFTKGTYKERPRSPIFVDWRVMDIDRADSRLVVTLKIPNRPDLESMAMRNLSKLEDETNELIQKYADLKIANILEDSIFIKLNVESSDAVKKFHQSYLRGDTTVLFERILEKAAILDQVINDETTVQVTITSPDELVAGNKCQHSTLEAFYDKNRAYLYEELSPRPICALLHEKGILDTDEVNEIFETRNWRRVDKTACLLKIMKEKDPETVEDFKECLLLTHHDYILRKITPSNQLDENTIKLTKTKKSQLMNIFRRYKDDKNHNFTPPGKLFGHPLEDVTTDVGLPKSVMEMLKILFRDGPHTTGIFRKSANAKKQKELKQKLDEEEVFMDDGEYDPVVIGAVLKEYLRSLPHCLLLEDYYDQWICLNEEEETPQKQAQIKQLLYTLPIYHFDLLRHLMCVLHYINKNRTENLMTAYNLAVCIAPCILWSKHNDPLKALATTNNSQDIVAYLIEHCVDIFGEETLLLLGEPCDSKLRHDSNTDSDSMFSVLSMPNSSSGGTNRRHNSDSLDSLDREVYIGDMNFSPNLAKMHISPSNLSRDSGLMMSDGQLNEDDNSSIEMLDLSRKSTYPRSVFQYMDRYKSYDCFYSYESQNPKPPPRKNKRRGQNQSPSLDTQRQHIIFSRTRNRYVYNNRLSGDAFESSTESLKSVDENVKNENSSVWNRKTFNSPMICKSNIVKEIDMRSNLDKFTRQQSGTDSTPPMSPQSKYSYMSESMDSLLSDSSGSAFLSRQYSRETDFSEKSGSWVSAEDKSEFHHLQKSHDDSSIDLDTSSSSLSQKNSVPKSLQNTRFLVYPNSSPGSARRNTYQNSSHQNVGARRSFRLLEETVAKVSGGSTTSKETEDIIASPKVPQFYLNSSGDMAPQSRSSEHSFSTLPHKNSQSTTVLDSYNSNMPIKHITKYSTGLVSSPPPHIIMHRNQRAPQKRDNHPVRASYDSALVSEVRKNSAESGNELRRQHSESFHLECPSCKSQPQRGDSPHSLSRSETDSEINRTLTNSPDKARPDQPPCYDQAMQRKFMIHMGLPLQISEKDEIRKKEAVALAKKLYENSLKSYMEDHLNSPSVQKYLPPSSPHQETVISAEVISESEDSDYEERNMEEIFVSINPKQLYEASRRAYEQSIMGERKVTHTQSGLSFDVSHFSNTKSRNQTVKKDSYMKPRRELPWSVKELRSMWDHKGDSGDSDNRNNNQFRPPPPPYQNPPPFRRLVDTSSNSSTGSTKSGRNTPAQRPHSVHGNLRGGPQRGENFSSAEDSDTGSRYSGHTISSSSSEEFSQWSRTNITEVSYV